MQLRMRILMQSLIILEITNLQILILVQTLIRRRPIRHAQERKLISTSFKLLDHACEILANLLDTWRKQTERMVVAEANEEDNDAGICRLAAELANFIWNLGGEFAFDYVGHEWIGFPAEEDDISVCYLIAKECYNGDQGESADEKEEDAF